MRADLGALVASLSEAAGRHVDGSSIELARNVAQSLYMLRSTGWPVDASEAFQTALEAIQHRVAHGWMRCARFEDAQACAQDMAWAWMGWCDLAEGA